MSFILDALKKSEEQRQQQTAQPEAGKRTLVLRSEAGRRQPARLLSAIALLVLLACGWTIYHLTAGSGTNVSSRETVATRSPQVLPAQPAPEPVAPPAIMESPVHAKQAENIEPAPVPRPLGLATDKTVTMTNDLPETGRPLKATAQSPVALEAASNTYPHFRDLPRSLREQMPDVAVSLHFYAEEPSRRLTRINGRLLRQGDNIGPSLQLIEILPVGTLLEYQGKRFLHD